jgi:hypothetical protein
MSNLHRGLSIDDSYQVSVVVMLVNRSGRNEQFHRGPSIDASYQFSIHLVKWFHRRRFLEINQSETRIAVIGTLYIALYIKNLNKYAFKYIFINSPCQRQRELLPSLGIRRRLTFHLLIFSSETMEGAL